MKLEIETRSYKIGENMKKTGLWCLMCIASAVCLALLSCASVDTSFEPAHSPQYLIRAKSDNGFVIAYQAHFSVDGDAVSEISAREYEKLTLGDGSEYKAINAKTYAFDINAAGNVPSAWQYVQNEYDDETYDVQLLAKELSQMNLNYSGSLYVLVTTFDEYKIIQVSNLDGRAVLDESYAMFRNGRQLQLPKGAKLCSLWRFYKHR